MIPFSLIDTNINFPQTEAARTINWYAEAIGTGKGKKFTLRTTPGLNLVARMGAAGGGRGIHTMISTREYHFGVRGNSFQEWDPGIGAYVERGQLGTIEGVVKFADNGKQVCLSDGVRGYGYDVTTQVFKRLDVVDASTPNPVNNPWPGVGPQTDAVFSALRVISIEGGTGFFWCSMQDDIFNWSATAGAEAESFPDPLVGLACLGQVFFPLGSNSNEAWTDQGFQDFPFRRVQAGSNIGVSSRDSICTFGGSAYFLGGSAEGKGIIYRSQGYNMVPISDQRTNSIIAQIADISDAVAFIYQEEGHVFYQISFISGDLTLVYDISTELWAQREYRNPVTGITSRRFEAFQAVYGGRNLVQDFRDGTVYALSRKFFTDAGDPVVRTKVFGTWPDEQTDFVSVPSFGAFMDMGNTPEGSEAPQAILSFSDDRGKTYGQEHYRALPFIGEYGKRVAWHGQGSTYGRNYKLKLVGNQEFTLRSAGLLEA
jgi:hypothetical protein